MIDYNVFLSILATRRSVRKFLPDPVPQSDIDKLITAASWAPSGTNHQNWHFIVIQTAAVKEQMSAAVQSEIKEIAAGITMAQAQQGFLAYTNYFTFFHKAPVVIAVIKTPYNSVTDKILRRYDLTKKFKSSTDVQGPAAAIQNLLLMAHAMGYGACWMTGPMFARERLEKIIGVNAPDELIALIPVGKPSHVAGAPHRKKLKDITAYL